MSEPTMNRREALTRGAAWLAALSQTGPALAATAPPDWPMHHGPDGNFNPRRSGHSRTHYTRNLPILLLGGGALGLRQGRHLDCSDNKTPLANVFVSIASALGVATERFADSTGPLQQLHA
jgi:hypothetical protein